MRRLGFYLKFRRLVFNLRRYRPPLSAGPNWVGFLPEEQGTAISETLFSIKHNKKGTDSISETLDSLRNVKSSSNCVIHFQQTAMLCETPLSESILSVRNSRNTWVTFHSPPSPSQPALQYRQCEHNGKYVYILGYQYMHPVWRRVRIPPP
jgi:hypothetical protein